MSKPIKVDGKPVIAVPFTMSEALDVRIALTSKAGTWTDRAVEFELDGRPNDAEVCRDISQKLLGLWERIRDAMDAAEESA